MNKAADKQDDKCKCGHTFDDDCAFCDGEAYSAEHDAHNLTDHHSTPPKQHSTVEDEIEHILELFAERIEMVDFKTSTALIKAELDPIYDQATHQILQLITKAVEEAQESIVDFMEYLQTGTQAERKAKLKAAKEWNESRTTLNTTKGEK